MYGDVVGWKGGNNFTGRKKRRKREAAREEEEEDRFLSARPELKREKCLPIVLSASKPLSLLHRFSLLLLLLLLLLLIAREHL